MDQPPEEASEDDLKKSSRRGKLQGAVLSGLKQDLKEKNRKIVALEEKCVLSSSFYNFWFHHCYFFR